MHPKSIYQPINDVRSKESVGVIKNFNALAFSTNTHEGQWNLWIDYIACIKYHFLPNMVLHVIPILEFQLCWFWIAKFTVLFFQGFEWFKEEENPLEWKFSLQNFKSRLSMQIQRRSLDCQHVVSMKQNKKFTLCHSSYFLVIYESNHRKNSTNCLFLKVIFRNLETQMYFYRLHWRLKLSET